MKQVGVVLSAVSLLVAVAVMGVMLWGMSVEMEEIGLRNRYEASGNTVETAMFRMRTTIKNLHSCTDEWADNFIKVVAEQVKGRPGRASGEPGGFAGVAVGPEGGAMPVVSGSSGMVVTRESEALGIPSTLYMKLANAIEGQLAAFVRAQDTRNDIWREHKTFCENPYHNWLGVSLVGKVLPKPEMVTSAEVKSSMESKQMSEDLMK